MDNENSNNENSNGDPDSNATLTDLPPKKRTIADWGKPFVKGDVRINRKGRPKTFNEWRDLVQEILQEPAVETDQKGVPLPNGKLTLIKIPKVDKDGLPVVDDNGLPVMVDHYATNAELLARKWLRSKDNQQDLINAGYGKVPNALDITSGGESLIKQMPDEEKLRRLQALARKALGDSGDTNVGSIIDVKITDSKSD